MPPIRIGIVTTTAREDARLDLMARTIGFAAKQAKDRAKFFWVIIDEKLDRSTAYGTADGFVFTYPPLPSVHRASGLPDHNRARNTGLAVALSKTASTNADYIVFIDDRTLVTRSFADVVIEAARLGVGYRATIKFLRDLQVGSDGDIDAHESGGLTFVKCQATSVAGGCFGAPAQRFIEVDGFDEAYSGQYGKEDVEAFVRLERAGVQWNMCKRAAALQLGTGAPPTAADRKDITEDRDALQGKRNHMLFKKLLADRRRTLPQGNGLKVAQETLMGRELFASGRPSPRDVPVPDAPPPVLEKTSDLTKDNIFKLDRPLFPFGTKAEFASSASEYVDKSETGPAPDELKVSTQLTSVPPAAPELDLDDLIDE
jgi:hypothetical protein